MVAVSMWWSSVERPCHVAWPIDMCGEMARPIGMFDSGFGGLTVARAVIDLLPAEDLVYIGDTGRYPYGPRAAGRGSRVRPAAGVEPGQATTTSRRSSSPATRRPQQRSTMLQQELPVLVVDVVEPGARALVQATHVGTRRRDRHRRHDRVGRVRTRRRAATGADVELDRRGVPRLRRVRRARPDHRRRDHGPRRAAAGAGQATPASTPCCSAAPTTRTSPA